MDVFAKCARCGATVPPCNAKETEEGTRVRFWAAVTTCTVDTDGGMALDLGGAEVLCPDCMMKLKEWISGGPEDPQGQEEAGQSYDGDSAERLATDLARAAKNVAATGLCTQQLACGYFGHSGDTTCHDWRAPSHHGECPAYDSDSPCSEIMFGDVHRRCKALGIDIEEDEDAKR